MRPAIALLLAFNASAVCAADDVIRWRTPAPTPAPAVEPPKPWKGPVETIALTYKFPIGIAEPADMQLATEDTTHTMALGASELWIPMQLRWLGKGVVWQRYCEIPDRFLVECRDGCNDVEGTPALEGAGQILLDHERGREPTYWISALHSIPDYLLLVMSDASIDPEAIRQYFLNEPFPKYSNERKLWISDEPSPEVEAKMLLSDRSIMLSQMAFAGTRYGYKFDLLEWYRPRKPGIYRFRVAWWLYPETIWNNYGRALWPRDAVYSPDIVVEVK